MPWLKTFMRHGKSRSGRGVGIDIGNYAIKLAILSNNRGRVRIEQLASVPIPPSMISSGLILDGEGLTEEIAGLFQRAGVRRDRVVLAVGGNDVFVRRVSIPRMSYAEAVRQIPQNSSLKLGIDPESHKVDIHIIDPDGQGATMLAIVVAARKDAIENRQRVVLDAGAMVHAVDVGVFAIFNAFAYCHSDSVQLRCTLLDIGHESSQIVILDRGAPAVARTVDVGVSHLIEQLSANSLLPEEAKRVIRSSNPPAIYEDVFRSWSESLIEQVRRSAASISRRESDTGPIYLTGGGAGIDGLAPFIQSLAGSSVSVFNPLRVLDYNEAGFPSDGQHGSSFALAIGLALRQVV